MKKSLAVLFLTLVTAGQLVAADAPKLTLKNRSSFTMESTSRNPFWPIGWKPSAQVTDPNAAAGDHAGSDVPPSAFLVSSITVQDGGRFAIINGRVMQEGQQFGLQMGAQTYQITVKSIQDGKVVLGRRDQTIEVPLRRK